MIKWIKKIFRIKDNRYINLKYELENGNFHNESVELENLPQRLTELKEELNPIKPFGQIDFIWCLVGNVVDKHSYGENKEIKIGIKQFSPKTKVYCFPPLWSDGFERIKVIGRPRKTSRFITVIIESKYVTNWRIQAVYSPHIIRTMIENNGWTFKDNDKLRILEMINSLNRR